MTADREMPSGAWARPLRAVGAHFFRDYAATCLCGAYMTWDVTPSRWGTYAEGPRNAKCEKKLTEYLAGGGV